MVKKYDLCDEEKAAVHKYLEIVGGAALPLVFVMAGGEGCELLNCTCDRSRRAYRLLRSAFMHYLGEIVIIGDIEGEDPQAAEDAAVAELRHHIQGYRARLDEKRAHEAAARTQAEQMVASLFGSPPSEEAPEEGKLVH